VSKWGLYTKFTAHQGQRGELVDMLLRAASGMREAAGCELYVVNLPVDANDSVWVTEIWRDAAAHQESLSSKAAQDLIQQARPLIAGIEQIKLETLGGHGIS
jgi:quinol monooxygenase YgiN